MHSMTCIGVIGCQPGRFIIVPNESIYSCAKLGDLFLGTQGGFYHSNLIFFYMYKSEIEHIFKELMSLTT